MLLKLDDHIVLLQILVIALSSSYYLLLYYKYTLDIVIVPNKLLLVLCSVTTNFAISNCKVGATIAIIVWPYIIKVMAEKQ